MSILDTQNEVTNDLAEVLKSDDSFSIDMLRVDVKNGIKKFIQIRDYPGSYTEEDIAKDVARHSAGIYETILRIYNRHGAEGQTSHSENGISRSFETDAELWQWVFPFVHVI